MESSAKERLARGSHGHDQWRYVRRLATFGFTLLLAIPCVAPLKAQAAASEQPQRMSISQVRQLSAAPPTARAYLDVEDAAGRPVTELSQARLSATVGPAVAALSSPRPFASTEEGVGTVFLVDISRSLRAEQFAEIRGAIDAWLSRMRPRDSAALIAFGSASRLVVDWTSDTAALRAALNGLQPTDDQTLLHQALADGLELGSRKDVGLPGRRAVIVLSDGRDEGSTLALEDILASVRTSPTPIYTIGFVPPNRSNRERDLDVLRRLAANSGGSFHEATATGLAASYTAIESAFRGVWVTDVTCLECAADGSAYRLQLELESAGRVLSSGAQLRLLPRVGGSAVQAGSSGQDSSVVGGATPPARPTTPESASVPAPAASTQQSNNDPGASGWLFSPRTLLFFWLPLLLGISLLAAALVQSRAENRRPGPQQSSRSSIDAMMRSDRSLGADQLYANKEDEPDASRPALGTGVGSSSFSLSLPRPADDAPGGPTSQFPMADLGSRADGRLDDFDSDREPSPLPSLDRRPPGDQVRNDGLGAPSFMPTDDLSPVPPSPLGADSLNGDGGMGADLSTPAHRAHYTLAPRVVRFVVLRGDSKGKQFRALLRDRLIVGSRSTADLVIVGEANVGPEQFELRQDGSDIVISNLDAKRPTLLNGHELDSRQILQAGDLVGNGDVILRTVLGDG